MALTLLLTTIIVLLALWGITYSDQEHESYKFSLVVILVGGLLVYSYIYHQTESNDLLVPLQAAWAVIKMFTGSSEYSRALQTDLFQQPLMQLVFWLIHAFALYITASATVKLFGKSLYRHFQLWRDRKKGLSLVFGLNKESLAFAKKLEKSGTVIYLDKEGSDIAEKLNKEDKSKHVSVGEIDDKVLKRFYIDGNRKSISVYALSTDEDANLRFAKALSSLQDRISLTLMGDEEDYLKEEWAKGFKNVYVTNPFVLAARQLIQQSPPYQVMGFVEGQAEEDFHLLQVGFGHIGQEVFKHIYMNTQFVGSQFKADIFAPDVETNTGRIRAMTRFMDDEGIRLHPYKAESSQFYEFVKGNDQSVKYIVIATGDDERNREFARHLRGLFPSARLHIVQTDGVFIDGEHFPNFTQELLDSAGLDEKAKLVNCAYNGKPEGEADELWSGLKYFHRMSSRASADYTGAIVKASGIYKETTEELSVPDDWWQQIQANNKLYDNLGRMEHLRWNAFYKAMGYSVMSKEEMQQRASQWTAGDGKFKKFITDDGQREHACLVSWEELPDVDRMVKDLFEQYGLVPNEQDNRPYQEADYDIVRIISKMYQKKLSALTEK